MENKESQIGDQADCRVVLSRRAFLKRGSGTAIGFAVIPSAGLIGSVVPEVAHAARFSNLDLSVELALMRMARDVFPHDKMEEKYYVDVIVQYDKKAAADSEFKNFIVSGVNSLNQRAIKRYGINYVDIASEGDRVNVLYDIEQSAFFQKVRADLMYGIYNNKDAWAFFGYEGSSWEKGGYIDRGFNDIDWV